jgi:hypothetical protein
VCTVDGKSERAIQFSISLRWSGLGHRLFDHMIERQLNLELSNVFPRLSNVFPRLKFLAGCGQFSDFSNKDTIQLSHMHVLYHFCDMRSISVWDEFDKVSFCLHMYFLWRHNLAPDKLENDQDIVTLIDLHIVLTYDCCHCFLAFYIFEWEYLRNDNNFLLPNTWVVLLSFTQPFTHSTFCLPNHFLFGTNPGHK